MSDCAICAELGTSVSWSGNQSPRAINKLVHVNDMLGRCPTCGTEYRFVLETEHAADHYMPDMSWTAVRIEK